MRAYRQAAPAAPSPNPAPCGALTHGPQSLQSVPRSQCTCQVGPGEAAAAAPTPWRPSSHTPSLALPPGQVSAHTVFTAASECGVCFFCFFCGCCSSCRFSCCFSCCCCCSCCCGTLVPPLPLVPPASLPPLPPLPRTRGADAFPINRLVVLLPTMKPMIRQAAPTRSTEPGRFLAAKPPRWKAIAAQSALNSPCKCLCAVQTFDSRYGCP